MTGISRVDRAAAVVAGLALGLGGAAWAESRGADWDSLDRGVAAAPEIAPECAEAVVSPAEAEAVAARLAGRGPEDPVSAFYRARGHAAVWLADAGPAAARLQALMAALAEAPAHALPAGRYGRAALAADLARIDAMGPAERAGLELALTEAFLTYARDVSSGVLEPERVDREIHHEPIRPDRRALLEGLVAAGDPAEMIAALPPAHPDYARLRGRLAEYRRLAGTGAWADPLAAQRTLREGARSADVEALRRRLMAMGDLGTQTAGGASERDGARVAANDIVTDVNLEAAGDPQSFDPTLVAAVKRFQARHGLNQDGVVGPATRAALNESPADRARQIAVNLERLRWLNRDLGDRHVMVNLAGFEMALVEDGQAVFTSRVVVGKARRHRTPEFSDEMEYMVVNPTWHVPRSIATKEILPKLQQDSSYLSRKGMRLVGSDLPADQIEWSFVTPSSFPGRIKQRPGSGNALGRVKFMFPNKWSIYLHDTPHKSLFGRDRRAYSHGCVRVQEPFEFAYRLLNAERPDGEEYFHRLLRTGRETYVQFDTHVPVHLTYRTAWVDDAGVDQFRGDVYGRDAKVFAALDAAGVELGL